MIQPQDLDTATGGGSRLTDLLYVGQKLIAKFNLIEDADENNSPLLFAKKGETLVVCKILDAGEMPIGVSHEDRTDSYFYARVSELDVCV
jgi:hypothetical protein